MLFVVFQLGSDRYAIEAHLIVEVLPLVQVKAVPGAPAGVAGLMNYRGRPVPVVDLYAAVLGRPARQRLNTRLIVTALEPERELVAVLAEDATQTLRFERAQFTEAKVTSSGASFLGPVAVDADGRLIQWVAVDRLLPPALRAALVKEASEA